MRRPIAILLIAALMSGLVPARADAYFWDWIDGLSGPQFGGDLTQLKVFCRSDEQEDVLKEYEAKLQALQVTYTTKMTPLIAATTAGAKNRQSANAAEASAQIAEIGRTSVSPAAATIEPLDLQIALYQRGLNAISAASRYVAATRAALKDANAQDDPGELFFEAVRWRRYAEGQAVWVDRVSRIANDPNRQAAFDATPFILGAIKGLPPARVADERWKGHSVPSGYLVSVCGADALDRRKDFISFELGISRRDRKPGNDVNRNRMYSYSVAYHRVLTPALDVGFGIGAARFTSHTADGVKLEPFYKLMLQPVIVDVRPLAIGKDKYSPDAWEQLLYVRFGMTTFPQGFEAGKFGGTSPEYPKWEFVRSVGVHVDFEPLIRKIRGRW